ncbi:MAG: hypothetical protein U1E56_01205 [Bauldia sp.]
MSAYWVFEYERGSLTPSGATPFAIDEPSHEELLAIARNTFAVDCDLLDRAVVTDSTGETLAEWSIRDHLLETAPAAG